MRQGEFEGWYFKQQGRGHTVAFIPAHHRTATGEETASLQILLDDRAWNLDIPAAEFFLQRKPFALRAGKCVFSLEGCRIDCRADGADFFGALRFLAPAPPAYDIMGPFRYMPAMQCRHSLLSLSHGVEGRLVLDGREVLFQNGLGYVEGDRGRSFPKRYLWTQCSEGNDCVMLSVADIPFCGGSFIGCISVVYTGGREYRLATYLGARPEKISSREIVLRQGAYRLQAILEEARPLPLRAPRQGGMDRVIRESLACRVRYRLSKGDKILFSLTGSQASFESEWPDEADGT